MSYVDGFVIVIPKNKMPAYKKMATIGKKMWKKYGAIDYVECVANDLKVMKGMLSFKKLTKVKKGETIVFSYIKYKSRAHRDAVNKKVMSDPSMNAVDMPMPFDMKKMAYGGFHVIVEK